MLTFYTYIHIHSTSVQIHEHMKLCVNTIALTYRPLRNKCSKQKTAAVFGR